MQSRVLPTSDLAVPSTRPRPTLGPALPLPRSIASPQLAACFPEISDLVGEQPCRFSDCLHVAEPGCAVRGAGLERYAFYLRFLHDIRVSCVCVCVFRARQRLYDQMRGRPARAMCCGSACLQRPARLGRAASVQPFVQRA